MMATDFDWRQARSPRVRELGWCLFSPAIVDQLPPATTLPWPVDEDRGAREILAALDRDPSPLERHLAGLADRRLGARFEAMWTFYLSQHPRFELLAHNLPVTRNGKTLGALDLLFRDRESDAVIHGEVAVKFYLYQPDRTEAPLARWIGPNPDDNLALKLERLASHQLALCRGEQARTALGRAGLPVPDHTAALMKGYLFHPLGRECDPPPPINPRHPRGAWLRQRELPALLARHPACHWAIVERGEWLQPLNPGGAADALRRRVAEHMAGSGQPLMLAMAGGDNTPGPLSRRYFVVPGKWPPYRTSAVQDRDAAPP